jgi:hypothetical protein
MSLLRRTGFIPIVVSVLVTICPALMSVRAGDDPSNFEYQPKQKVKGKPPPDDRADAKRTYDLDPTIHEIEGEFNDCAALHLIRLELSRRDDRLGEPVDLSEKKLRQLNSSRSLQTKLKALTDRNDEGCKAADQKTAEAIIQVYELVIAFPQQGREGAARAPLSLYAAVRVCQSLNDLSEIHTNRDLIHVPPLCFAAPDDETRCKAEEARRAEIDGTLKRVFQEKVSPLLAR